MTSVTLTSLRELYRSFAGFPDPRPVWLKEFNGNTPGGYYHFLFQFAKRFRPGVVWEIGTGKGGSAAHFAFGNPDGVVVTVDVRAESKAGVERMRLPNVVAVHSDSISAIAEMQWMPSLDVLFIDGEHEGGLASREYRAYLRFVRKGGVIFFDDIRLNSGMSTMWEEIPEPKLEMSTLHSNAGFGVAINVPL